MKKNIAVFIDRDGVINKERRKKYIYKLKDFKFYKNTFEALKAVPKSFKKIVITNQAGIAKGIFTKKDYQKISDFMLKKFKQQKIKIDKIYLCPHSPSDNCQCRKPKTGMILEAQKHFKLDLKNSWLIGDKTSDILCGKNAGIKTILVATGFGGKNHSYKVKADFKARNLNSAVKKIIALQKN